MWTSCPTLTVCSNILIGKDITYMSNRGPSLPPNVVTRQPEPPRGKAPDSGNTPPRAEQPPTHGWKLYDPNGWRQPRRGGTAALAHRLGGSATVASLANGDRCGGPTLSNRIVPASFDSRSTGGGKKKILTRLAFRPVGQLHTPFRSSFWLKQREKILSQEFFWLNPIGLKCHTNTSLPR